MQREHKIMLMFDACLCMQYELIEKKTNHTKNIYIIKMN
jgi:hypothetical protein